MLSFVFVSVTTFEIFTSEKIFAYLHHWRAGEASFCEKSQSIYPTLLDNTLHFLQCRIWRIYWDFWKDFILLWSIVNSSCLIVEFSKTNYCKAFLALRTSYFEGSLRDWNEIRVFCLFCQRDVSYYDSRDLGMISYVLVFVTLCLPNGVHSSCHFPLVC